MLHHDSVEKEKDWEALLYIDTGQYIKARPKQLQRQAKYSFMDPSTIYQRTTMAS